MFGDYSSDVFEFCFVEGGVDDFDFFVVCVPDFLENLG